MGKLATVTLVGKTPYSQSRPHKVEKLNKEIPEDYEKRTWMERLHTTAEGQVFIPPMGLKNCVAEVAKFLSIQIPGKGKATYTKHFEAGVACLQPAMLFYPGEPDRPILKDEVRGDWIFTPADGVKGSGKRVWKCYPVIDKWITSVEFFITDDTITEEVFWTHLEQAGFLIGIGRFRYRNGGYYGGFKLEDKVWTDLNTYQAA